jgi:hypothetical protein
MPNIPTPRAAQTPQPLNRSQQIQKFIFQLNDISSYPGSRPNPMHFLAVDRFAIQCHRLLVYLVAYLSEPIN